MNVDKGVSILVTIVILAIITTLVLPNRQTPQVIRSFWGGFANSIKVAQGRG
jgi:Tfp pilus assembly protein FimT